jgi:hypothetical protein
MRFLYFLGWMLLILAFAAGAAEVVPRNLSRGGGWFVSAYELWYAAMPGKLVVAQIQVERLSPALWDPIVTGLLSFPAWLLLGLPGGTLTWFFRPHKKMSPEFLEDLKRHEEHFQLYETLAREAREAGFDDSEDDRAPTTELLFPDSGDPEFLENPPGFETDSSGSGEGR